MSNAQTDITIANLHTEVETALNSIQQHNIVDGFKTQSKSNVLKVNEIVHYIDSFSDAKIEVTISEVHTDNTHV